jgi:hypothetical protein
MYDETAPRNRLQRLCAIIDHQLANGWFSIRIVDYQIEYAKMGGEKQRTPENSTG